MTDLVWCQCPKCRESTDLKRLGLPFQTTVKPNGKIHVLPMERRVQCGFCKTIFLTDAPTMLESMGDDGVYDTSF